MLLLPFSLAWRSDFVGGDIAIDIHDVRLSADVCLWREIVRVLSSTAEIIPLRTTTQGLGVYLTGAHAGGNRGEMRWKKGVEVYVRPLGPIPLTIFFLPVVSASLPETDLRIVGNA